MGVIILGQLTKRYFLFSFDEVAEFSHPFLVFTHSRLPPLSLRDLGVMYYAFSEII